MVNVVGVGLFYYLVFTGYNAESVTLAGWLFRRGEEKTYLGRGGGWMAPCRGRKARDRMINCAYIHCERSHAVFCLGKWHSHGLSNEWLGMTTRNGWLYWRGVAQIFLLSWLL